jgi:nucleolar GTP-binding protein
MVDTPGLLDRPMDERNLIEMQAIAALENVGDVLVFLIDASETGGTSLDEQLNLLDEVRILVTERPIIIAHSKSDLLKEIPEDAEYLLSAISGEGIEEFRTTLIETIGADVIDNPLSLPDNWHVEEMILEPLGTKYEIEKRKEMGNG